MKRQEVFPLFPGWEQVHCRDTPINKFAGIHFYTWVEKGTVRVKCLSYVVILSDLENLEDVTYSLRVEERS